MENKRKVLIVEDDPYLLEFYASLEELLKDSVDITIANDGANGIKALKSGKFDALVLDLIMPEVDGYAVLEFIKKEGLDKSLEISILTNLNTGNDKDKTQALGASAYYIKADLSNKILKQILTGQSVS